MEPKAVSKDHYCVFLASPGDVNPERKYVREFFHQFNISTAREWGAQFDVVDWENYATAGVGRPQQLITQATLEKYKSSLALVVGLMGGRFGTPSGEAESGTEEEFLWAVEHWRNNRWPEIKWFFRKRPDFGNFDDPDAMRAAAAQWEKVQKFRRNLREGDPPLLYKEFEHFDDFKEVFQRDLNIWLNERERPWFKPVESVVEQPSAEPEQADRERRDHAGPRPPTPDLVHPYLLQPNFTGRIAERECLTEWFTGGSRPVCVVEAIGGMGKSALAWFWLHADVLGIPPAGYSEAHREDLGVPEDRRPEGVLFWSFYEQDSHFGAFLDRAARYVGVSDDSSAGLSDREKLDIVIGALGQHRILLILDGFERELRAYAGYRAPYQGDVAGGGDDNDCVDPRAAEFLQSAASLALAGRVLLTSRLFPNELINLAGCRHERLENLALDDVVNFFEATGVTGTRAEIAQAVAPYGGHPLSVSLLARAIVKDRRMKGDIKASGRQTVLDKLKGKHGHDILAVAYDEMSDERRELLSRIAAFRSPMDYKAIESVASVKGAKLDAALDELEARGLLLRDPDGERYDLHPIVRQYAYDRLADKAGVHGRLREYFEARPAPERVETLADLAPTIELYWHTVGAGRFDPACDLYYERLSQPLYFRFGAYERAIELLGALFPDGEDRPPRLESESDQAWTLNGLANSYSRSGQPRRAVLLSQMDIEIDEKRGYKKGVAISLGNLAHMAQLPLGRLEAAEGTLRGSIELCREIADEFWEAVGHQKLGRLLAYRGRFAEAERELETALKSFHAQGERQSECVVWAYRALLGLLRGDAEAARPSGRHPEASLPTKICGR